ncbi:MAG: hypothetical protein LLG04_08500 [Parachlamydia sp.]|nr:hypothetical protein [Parachlamydia sp.]
MSAVSSAVGGLAASARSALASFSSTSFTPSTMSTKVLGYVASATLPSLFYDCSYYAAKGGQAVLGFSGNVASLILTKVHPNLGTISEKTQTGIQQAADNADKVATDLLLDSCYPDFSAGEMAGPFLMTFGSGWMAARSLHHVAKDTKMLVMGQRAEVIQKTQLITPGARVSDEKFIPRSATNLSLSILRNLVLAPVFAGIGYYTEQGIVNRLTEVGARTLPIPAITLTAATIYMAVQAYSWLHSKEDPASIRVEQEFEPTEQAKEIEE